MKKILIAVAAVLMATSATTSVAGLFTIDLVNNPVGYDGDVIYQNTTYSTSGSGVIDPFLGVGDAQSPVIWGFNNDAGAPESPYVDKTKTHSLTLNEVPEVVLLGEEYREFLLDNNQQSGGLAKSQIDLLELEIYTVDSDPNINSLAALRATGTLVYSLDDATDDGTVSIDADPPGSGKADMFLYVPSSRFTAFSGGESATNVYMYSSFGSNNDGFEEWAVLTAEHANDTPPLPPIDPDVPQDEEPAMPEPSALGAIGLVLLRLRKRRTQ